MSATPNATEARSLHRTAGLRLLDVRCACDDPSFAPAEVAQEDALVFPRHGAFVCEIEGEEFVVDTGSALLLEPGLVYRVRHPLRGGDRCTVLALAPRIIEEIRSGAPGPSRCARIIHTPRAVDHLQRTLVAAAASGELEAFAAQEMLRLLAARALGLAAPAPVRPSHRSLAGAARELLADRALAPEHLEALAARLGCSPAHLSRAFHAATGVRLHEYRLRLRLREALRRLEDGESDLTRLALDLGFADHSHFTGAFKGAFGVPPSRWRGLRRAQRLAAARADKDLQAALPPAS